MERSSIDGHEERQLLPQDSSNSDQIVPELNDPLEDQIPVQAIHTQISILRDVSSTTLPLVLVHFIENLSSFMQTLIINKYTGSDSLASISYINRISSFLLSGGAILNTTDYFFSKGFAEDDSHAKVSIMAQRALVVATMLGVTSFIVMQISNFLMPIMPLATDEAAHVREYNILFSFAILPLFIINVLSSLIACTDKKLYLIPCFFLTEAFNNAFLMFFLSTSLLKSKYKDLALAILCGTLCSLMLFLCVVRFIKYYKNFPIFKGWIHSPRNHIKEILKLGSPIMIFDLTLFLTRIIQISIISSINKNSLIMFEIMSQVLSLYEPIPRGYIRAMGIYVAKNKEQLSSSVIKNINQYSMLGLLSIFSIPLFLSLVLPSKIVGIFDGNLSFSSSQLRLNFLTFMFSKISQYIQLMISSNLKSIGITLKPSIYLSVFALLSMLISYILGNKMELGLNGVNMGIGICYSLCSYVQWTLWKYNSHRNVSSLDSENTVSLTI